MILIFGSIETTFESSSIFGGSWESIENWLEPKTKPPSGNLACLPKSVKRSVHVEGDRNKFICLIITK